MSEILNLYGMVRHRLELLDLPPSLHEDKDVFIAACKMADICLLAKHGKVELKGSRQ